MAKMRAAETNLGAPPLLDALREELEGLSNKTGIIARRVSAVARIKKIRGTHIAQLGNVFFRKTKFGHIVFHFGAGRKILKMILFGYRTDVIDLLD